MKYVLYGILGFIAFIAVTFTLNSLGMISYSFFGAWQESIRADIQRESFAYTQGNMNNLQQMLNDYNTADASGQQAILSGVRAQYGSVDTSEFPAHLRDFLRTAGIY